MDSLWLEQCRQGDSLAIERMVAAYQRDVYRLALSILDEPHEAEDAAQEVFIAALRALNSFQGEAAFKTWLFRIAINVSRTRLQRRNRRDWLLGILHGLQRHDSAPPQLEEQAIQDETDSALWRAIRALDDRHRIPLILRYYHDLPVSDIAELIGIPVGTVHSRLNHARQRLHAFLEGNHP